MAYAGKVGESRFRPAEMAETSHHGVGTVATGIAVGLLVGAGLALMFAPQEGRDMRRLLRRRMRRIAHRGQDAWLDLGDELRRAAVRVRRARRRRMAAEPALD